MFKVLRKADIILLLALCLLGAVLTVWSVRTAAASSSGAEVIITIDGAEYGRYSHQVVISDGTVHMEEASCKNQICVHQGIINASGQMIVCLPNGVIAEIRAADSSQAEYDAVSQ